MNVPEFQAKWRGATLKERSAAQEHFLDLCRLLGMPTPAEADKTGAFYTFEKGATKTAGGQGFADVWWEGRFAWEYKGHRADLKAEDRHPLAYSEGVGHPLGRGQKVVEIKWHKSHYPPPPFWPVRREWV
jgi:hypothetical protein